MKMNVFAALMALVLISTTIPPCLASEDLKQRQNEITARSYYELGSALMQQTKYHNSQCALLGSIRLGGLNQPKTWAELGLVMLKRGRYNDSSDCFNISMNYHPGAFSGSIIPFKTDYKFIELASPYYLGNYNNLLKDLNNATESNPKLAPMWVVKGLVLYKLNKSDDALKSFDKALALMNATK